MNITINNSFEFGQKLYRLSCKVKNVYKPCTLCNNTRKVSIKDTDSGEVYSVTCPKCSGKQIKGDSRYCISINTYSMETLEVESVTVSRKGISARLVQGCYGGTVIRLLPDDDRTVLVEKNSGFCSSDVIYYTSKSECAAEMRRLNKLEKEKAEKFLRGESE